MYVIFAIIYKLTKNGKIRQNTAKFSKTHKKMLQKAYPLEQFLYINLVRARVFLLIRLMVKVELFNLCFQTNTSIVSPLYGSAKILSSAIKRRKNHFI